MTLPYRDPLQEREFLEEQFKSYFAEADAAEKAQADADAAVQAAAEATRATTEAQNRYWGFVVAPESLEHGQPLPVDHFWLVDVVKESWCLPYYKNQTWIKKHLFKVGEYPDRLINSGLITKVGFDILMKNKRHAKQARDRDLIAKKRAAKRAAIESSATKSTDADGVEIPFNY